ncbi:MAG TPA: hypothetical protein VF748_16020 [Candidatus Acidoferrum sp.]
MNRAILTVQRFFPHVRKVEDAKENLAIEVSEVDVNSAEVKQHHACAMAVACKRKTHADGVIVSVGTAFLIKGNIAYRYRVPESVAREVVSFDRNAGFAPGEYQLKRPLPCQRLGARKNQARVGKGHPHPHKGKPDRHMTAGIRTVLATAAT